jgi:hypothetical protein
MLIDLLIDSALVSLSTFSVHTIINTKIECTMHMTMIIASTDHAHDHDHSFSKHQNAPTDTSKCTTHMTMIILMSFEAMLTFPKSIHHAQN